MMLRFGRSRWAGFTLIEIMIVIAIIVILAAVAIPNIRQARAEALFQACCQNVTTIGKAIAMAQVRKSDYELSGRSLRFYNPSATWVLLEGDGDSDCARLVEKGYLAKALVCPVNGYEYEIMYWKRGFGFVCNGVYDGSAGSKKWIVRCLDWHNSIPMSYSLKGSTTVYEDDYWAPVYAVGLGLGYEG